MNNEDKQRFLRYRKGYKPQSDDIDILLYTKKQEELKASKQKQVLGYINECNVNSDTLIKNITNK